MNLTGYARREWTLEETSEGPRVVIPAPQLWPVTLFLGVWLAGWAAGEVSAVKALLEIARTQDGPLALLPGAFLLFWLAGWTAGGLFALAVALFSLQGREVATLSNGTLLVRLETFFGLGWTWKLPVAGMAPPRLKLSEVPVGRVGALPDGAKPQVFDFAYIALESGRRKWRLGLPMAEERARDLLYTLQTRFGLPRD